MMFRADEANRDYPPQTVFEQCYDQIIYNHPEIWTNDLLRNDPKLKSAYEDFSKRDTFNTLRYYEQNYDCAGMCDKPMFYLTKPLSDGPPTQDCVEAVITSFTDNMFVLIVALISSICLFTAACSATSTFIREIRSSRDE
jgi:hypothetical protein